MLVRQDRDLNKGIENFPEEKSNRQKSKKITNQTDSRQTIKQTEEKTNKQTVDRKTNKSQTNEHDGHSIHLKTVKVKYGPKTSPRPKVLI